MKDISILWFNNDLRIRDNLSALRASDSSFPLICLFCFDPSWLKPNRLNSASLGSHRHHFLIESLSSLNAQLNLLGQHLVVEFDHPERSFSKLNEMYNIKEIFHSVYPGYNERKTLSRVKKQLTEARFIGSHTHTLFELDDLPFDLEHLPSTFSKFRKTVEESMLRNPMQAPNYLPPSPIPAESKHNKIPLPKEKKTTSMEGGEQAAWQRVSNFFSSNAPLTYKDTRNKLDGDFYATKFSPWLALGCISARQIIKELRTFESNHKANESTYWIYFELLWREYFQWYAYCHKEKLFQKGGITNQNCRQCFYGERFQRWCYGNTPYPLVNACMKQLNATGFMSNRGRQIAASALIYEFNIDWRFGAAYFEQQLIDYDVASNWGNWQYIAGVGADPKGGRRFNQEKQQQIYDPEEEFINQWRGNVFDGQLDSVDAADWPIFTVDEKQK
ncbi:DASH family cryptochrome [Pleionea sediminis]|uniref:DASH family cryptochrome n=1 Tax=Pleionea sediminis TaxID=2569479 RepID=UPI00197B5FA0|nr:DASH family cryptochrome [Pleionea sediminis]